MTVTGEPSLDSIPQKQSLSRAGQQPGSGNHQEARPKQTISAALHKNKLKQLKKQIKQAKIVAESQLRQIKELSDLYSLSLDRKHEREARQDDDGQAKGKITVETRQAKLLRQICESNYILVQQVTSGKKTALKDRIKELEEELAGLQAQFDSEKTMLISKEDHKKFIDELHAMHRTESSRIKELNDNLKQQVSLQQEALQQSQAMVEEFKSKAADSHNELQYTKMQLTKATEEVKAAQVKLAAAKKAEQLLKQQEEELERLREQLHDLAQEKKRAEAAHRDTVMDLNGKLNEKDQLLHQAKQVQEKLKEREKELNADAQRNLKAMQSYDAELTSQTEKYNQLKKHSKEMALQIDNLKISKEQQALKLKEQVKQCGELEAQIDSLSRKLEEKDAEVSKQKTAMA